MFIVDSILAYISGKEKKKNTNHKQTPKKPTKTKLNFLCLLFAFLPSKPFYLNGTDIKTWLFCFVKTLISVLCMQHLVCFCYGGGLFLFCLFVFGSSGSPFDVCVCVCV